MRKLLHIVILLGCLVVISVFVGQVRLAAQEQDIPVNCGDVIDGEFTSSGQEIVYLIELEPRDQVAVRGSSVGESLRFDIAINGPSGVLVAYSGTPGFAESQEDFDNNPYAESVVLSERGTYRIYIHNEQGFGLYTLTIQCQPGGATSRSINPTTSPLSAPEVGVPELPPVDFANAVLLPLNMSGLNQGQIPAAGDVILGFTFDAIAADVVHIEFNRISGNLNLGFVVIAYPRQIVFQSSLVTASDLDTSFVIPADAQYIVGIFRIELLPPPVPEATVFQFTLTKMP